MKDYFSSDKYFNSWVLLSRVQHAVLKAREIELAEYDILPRRAAVLLTIAVLGSEATPGEISRRLFREPHSVSTILSRMGKDGLVTKAHNKHKKGTVRVNLTKKGEQALKHSFKRESIHEIISTLSDEEHRQMDTMLQKLLDKAMQKVGEYRLALTIWKV